MGYQKFIVLCFILSMFSSINIQSSVGAQITETLIPVADTYVESSDPSANHGGADNLHISNNSLGEDIVFVRFDLSNIAGNITLLSFKIYPTLLTETHLLGIHHVSDNSWNENTINYNNMPIYDSVALDTKLVTNTDISYSFDVDSLIDDGVSLTTISLAVLVEESTQSGFLFIGDRNVNEFIGEPPKLDVFYLVDDPTTTTSSSIFDRFSSSSSTSETTPFWILSIFLVIPILYWFKKHKKS